MVDRKARDEYAQLLRHFVAGRMTNFEYDDAGQSICTTDRAVNAIFNDIWYIYCDIRKHTMTGRHAVSKEGRVVIARYILFLHSELEYQWPQPPLWRSLLNLLTLGIFGRLFPLATGGGDEAAWPFFRQYDREQAMAHPRLLAGRKSA